MQLIRSQRPELGAPSNRLAGWFRDPFLGMRSWPSLFEWGFPFEGWEGGRRLAADLYEDEDAFHLRVEMPGVKKDELRVELENAVLTVTCERRDTGRQGAETAACCARSVSLPDGVAADKLRAKLEDGVLTVTMPKCEASKPRAIQID